MNKTELVNYVAKQAGLTKVQAKKAVSAVYTAVSDSLAEGEKVSLVGLGTFSVIEKPARVGRNPFTQETIEIPKRKVVKFKAGQQLRDKVK